MKRLSRLEDEETKPFGVEAIKSFFHLIKKRILGEFRYICERYFWRAKARKGKKKFVARRKGDNLNESLGTSFKKTTNIYCTREEVVHGMIFKEDVQLGGTIY